MITARFEPGTGYVKVPGLWQYDRGQVLRIEGLDLTGTVSVDFSLSSKGDGEAIPIACVTKNGIAEAAVPDILLAAGRDKDYAIYAYIYRSTAKAGETTEMVAMTVKARPSRQGQDKPAPPDQFADAIESVNDAANRAEYAMAMAESDVGETRQMLDEARDYVESEKSSFVGYGKRESGIRYANTLTATAEGAGRAEAQDAWEAPLLDLQVAGKSVQEAEPTPEAPQPVKGVGDGGSVEVTVSGRNILDVKAWFDSRNVVYTKDGESYTVTIMGDGYIIPLRFAESEVEVTLSAESIETDASQCYRIELLNEAGQRTGYVGMVNANTGIVLKCTARASQMKLNYATRGEATFTGIQLEYGSVKSDYEPYTGQTVAIPLEPMHGIDDYKDRICCKDGEWGMERWISRKILTGDERWVQHISDNVVTNTLSTGIDNATVGSGHPAKCTHSEFEMLRYMGNRGNGLTSYRTPSSSILWTQPGITPEAWKAYLKGQHDAGTAVTVVYELAKPVWEPFPAATQEALNALTTYRAYTCVGVSDPLQPDVCLTYVQDTRKVIESLQLDTAEQITGLQAQIDQLMVSNHLN